MIEAIILMYRFLVITFALTACGGSFSFEGPVHKIPFARTEWEPLISHRTPDAQDKEESSDDKIDNGDIRSKMAARANELLDASPRHSDYGTHDLKTILDSVMPGHGWTASRGLSSLVDRAKSAGAYHTSARPDRGDIVLFHNQVDANGNGEIDDWLTGCGVVVDTRGRRFEAVIRTGYAPRRIIAWPDGPDTTMIDGRKANSFIRVPHRSDPSGTAYLAGRLYAGFIDVEALAESGVDK